MLGEAVNRLRPDFIDGSYRLPVSDGSGRDRKLLRKAVDLLAEAGWTVTDQGLTNAAGEPFAFTITVQTRDQEKIALHYQRTLKAIGIKAEVRIVDSAQFSALQTSYEYDMIPATWFNSLSPGNEQMLYFGSEGRTVQGTRNYPGIADPAVDAAIKAMLDATSQEDFVAAVHAEDRLLVSGFYMVPLYRCGRPVGGALEPHRTAGNAAAARASRQRHSGAILEPSRAKHRPPASTSRATAWRGSLPEKTALIVAGDDHRTLELWRARRCGAAAGGRPAPVRRRSRASGCSSAWAIRSISRCCSLPPMQWAPCRSPPRPC